ncbi:unnamed protein product [Parnassius apollo]|uniref:(apollo) hypothetical protein n=1 Tax=Parnassius apollo TaxID=110799 RepID=A0A8S3XXN7_PARAO|nr:unnamed protein product [Parnassius apollo]
MAENALPQAEQPAHVDAAVNTPVQVDSNDDGVDQELELEQMRSTLKDSKFIRYKSRCGNAQYASRQSTATSPNSLKISESGIVFGAALAVCRIIGAKLSTAGRATGQISYIPAWRIRIEEHIAKSRALIGRLICFRLANNRPRILLTSRMKLAGTNVSFVLSHYVLPYLIQFVKNRYLRRFFYFL